MGVGGGLRTNTKVFPDGGGGFMRGDMMDLSLESAQSPYGGEGDSIFKI